MKAGSVAGVAGKRATKAQQKAQRQKAEESKIGVNTMTTLMGAGSKTEKVAKGGKKNAGKNNAT